MVVLASFTLTGGSWIKVMHHPYLHPKMRMNHGSYGIRNQQCMPVHLKLIGVCYAFQLLIALINDHLP